ncbi:MAG TPA: 2-phospho-L-lactate transferase [Acidimicrobiaceae bacterium]|nr:2-phospho-L-lactate transferase [Acidimicrobiaceae bacterium]
MTVVALAGGVGAARLLRGLVQVVAPSDVTAVVNTGDDTELHGLHISPDLDTVCYTLAGRNDESRGWGLRHETWTAMDALEELGGETWFRLGDSDLATHLYRTQRMSEGAPLSTVTAEIAERMGVAVRLLPMTDEPVRTWLRLVSDQREVPFQDYFVRLRHSVAVSAVRFDGADRAAPAPGVVEAIDGAEVVVISPSNPVVSIGPILAMPAITAALRRRRDQVVAVSPLVGGAALKGPADRLLVELGEEASSAGVARRYTEVCGTLVIDERDRADEESVAALGMRCVVAPTVMSGPGEAAALAKVALEAGRTHGSGKRP